MPHDFVSRRIRAAGGVCAFQVYGKATYEAKWHVIDCMVTHRRDIGGRFPLVGGTLITWTHSIIAMGWDVARRVLEEQRQNPCSRDFPLAVTGGRLRDAARREAAGGSRFVSCSEIIAHECGHTGQARRMKAFYWPIGTSLTLFREGKYAWNRFENQASETGLFGGIVSGSVVPELRSVLE